MNATERLRALLDERGVEWGNIRRDGSESNYLTEWQYDGTSSRAIATEWAVGSGLSIEIHHYDLTPEQAVEATLGRGTCKVEGSIDYGEFGCWQYDLSCGCRILWPDSEPPTFCPECGRRVEP